MQNASKGFEITYGVSLGKLRPIIPTAPDEIVDFLNKRGVIKKLWKWAHKFPKGTEKWIEDCDEAITTWLHTGAEPCLENKFKEEYFRLSQWMDDRVEIIKGCN